MDVLVSIPDGTKGGAVVELAVQPDGQVVADVRIPGPGKRLRG